MRDDQEIERSAGMNVQGILGLIVLLGALNALSYFFDWGWTFF